MKVKYSDKQCDHPGCEKFIKQRLVNLSDKLTKCYKHYCAEEAKRGHFVNHKNRKDRIEAGLPVKSNLKSDQI